MKKLNLLLLLIPFIIFACKKDDDNDVDTTPPEVNVHSPSEKESVQAGEAMYFSATFTDNVELGRYTLDIHEAFDGHDHGKNYEAFRFELTDQELIGASHFVDMDIDIPEETVPGKYHLTIYVTDKAGNSLNINGAHSKTIEFYIETEDFSPVFNISSPEQGQKFNATQNISITGSINGFIDIEEVEIKLIHKQSNEVVWEWEKDHIDKEVYEINQNVTVDASWPTGAYEIDIEVELVNGRHYHMEPHLEIIIE